jgi:hypothetical protein
MLILEQLSVRCLSFQRLERMIMKGTMTQTAGGSKSNNNDDKCTTDSKPGTKHAATTMRADATEPVGTTRKAEVERAI